MELRITNFTGRAEEQDKLFLPDIKQFLRKKFERGYYFGQEQLLRTGTYKQMGWKYDFKPYLKRFLVSQYGSWQQYYCINKTALRKLLHGHVDEIIEVENENTD